MGSEIILHATATGKAWLASLPENEALRIVCTRGFQPDGRTGPNAITGVEALRRHLDETRQRGFALAIEEGEIGTIAMAITFRSSPEADAPVAGTLSVAGPAARMQTERREPIAAALRQAAGEMAEIWPLRRRQNAARQIPVASSHLSPLLKTGTPA